jgi:hypothetical protein
MLFNVPLVVLHGGCGEVLPPVPFARIVVKLDSITDCLLEAGPKLCLLLFCGLLSGSFGTKSDGVAVRIGEGEVLTRSRLVPSPEVAPDVLSV